MAAMLNASRPAFKPCLIAPIMHSLAAMVLLRVFAPLFATALVMGNPASAASEPPKDALDAVLFGADEPADNVLAVSVSDDGTRMRIAGDIENGSFRKVKRVLEPAANVRTIWLESDGGMVLEAFLIAAMVRERQLDTFVDSNCASACTLILAAGKSRAAYARAKIGFHNSVALDDKGNLLKGARAERENKEPDFMQAAAFYRAGVSDSFVQRALSTPNSSIWEPPHTEMLSANMLTRSLDDKERLALTGWGPSWPEIAATLKADPVARIVAEKDPEAFEEAVSTAWATSLTLKNGKPAYAAQLLAEAIHVRAFKAPDALFQRYLTMTGEPRLASSPKAGSIWAREAETSEAEQCPVLPTTSDALRDILSPAPDAATQSLVADLFATKDEAAPLKWEEAAKIYDAFSTNVSARIEPDKRKRRKALRTLADCVWERHALEEIKARPREERAMLIRAIGFVEAE